ncbi:MAG: hypothetical protein WCW56_00740 [Candidatus Paceibacterota bacterium]|jgi:hypothetical protein
MNKRHKNFFSIILTIGIFVFFLVATLAWSASDSINVSLQVAGVSTTCNDPTANNFGGALPCTYGHGGPTDVPGCTDVTALNYNSAANVNDGSCQYPQGVPNVSNFQSYYDIGQDKVYLTWVRPVFAKFKTVRIVRSTVGVPASPQEGAVVYEGTGELAIDSAVETKIRYYYSAFVQSTDDLYSSGAVTSTIGLHDDEEEPPVSTTTPPFSTSTDDEIIPPATTTPYVDPFALLPMATATDPELIKLTVGDFILRQEGELTKYFGEGSIVTVKGKKELIFEIEKSALPAVLKTIGVVISDPKKPSRSFSFIMTDNGSGRYSATLSPFMRNGVFPVTFYIINYKDQTMKKVSGNLQVAGVSFLASSSLLKEIRKYGEPMAIAIGLGVGLTQIAIFSSGANSIYDIFLLLLRLFYSFLAWLGIRRKKPEWGTVYDSVTKQPIDPAFVSVSNVAGEEVTSAITDIDGRFGFLLPKNVYYIKVGKTNYRFPSINLKDKTADELYDNLYFGSPLAHDGNQIIKLNVPLDPIGFDWNEFAKSKINFFKIYTKKEALRRRIFAGVFYLGFAISTLNLLVSPSAFDFFLVLIYSAIFIYQRILVVKHKIVSVRRSSGEPLPFSLIRLYLPGIDQPIKSTTTDALGRFYALVRPGIYYLTVEEKLPDGSYKKIYQSENINMPKGVLDKDFVV